MSEYTSKGEKRMTLSYKGQKQSTTRKQDKQHLKRKEREEESKKGGRGNIKRRLWHPGPICSGSGYSRGIWTRGMAVPLSSSEHPMREFRRRHSAVSEDDCVWRRS